MLQYFLLLLHFFFFIINDRHVDENYNSSVHVTKTRVTTVKERIIPIQVESASNGNRNGSGTGERLIPIQRTSESGMNGRGEDQASKPALPAKPLSPPTKKAASPQQPLHVVTSPTLVANAAGIVPKSKNVAQREENGGLLVKQREGRSPEVVPEPEVEPEPPKEVVDVEENEEEFYNGGRTSPPCGMRERALLCPIQEEDAESTASTNSVNVNNLKPKANSKKSPAAAAIEVAKTNGVSANGVKEEIHDGHYFIKVLSVLLPLRSC